MARARSGLLATALLAAVCLVAFRWTATPAFVPPPSAQVGSTVQLRGANAAAMATAAGGMAASMPGVSFAEDEYIPYRMNGEWTLEYLIQFGGITIAMMFFCFFSYLILTKLRII